MTIKKKLIGYGYTDSNGVATLDYNENGTEISTLAPTGSSGYIGRGVGSVQLEAGLHNSGTVVSEPSSVLDCEFYDGGVTGNKNNSYYDNVANSNIEVTPQGTVLTSKNGTTGANQMPNKNNTSTGSIDNVKDWQPPFAFEITFVSSANIKSQIGILSTTTSARRLDQLGISQVDNTHIRAVVENSLVKYYVNDEFVIQKTDMDTDTKCACLIQCQATDRIVYKDVKIYPI